MAINVGAFLKISTAVLHFYVPVRKNFDFEKMRAFIGRWFVGNFLFLHHDFKVESMRVRFSALNQLRNTIINA